MFSSIKKKKNEKELDKTLSEQLTVKYFTIPYLWWIFSFNVRNNHYPCQYQLFRQDRKNSPRTLFQRVPLLFGVVFVPHPNAALL